jgi:hypothetical protein
MRNRELDARIGPLSNEGAFRGRRSREVVGTNRNGKRLLFWSPRVLCIAFAVFISLFALDVFGEGYGFWRTALALAMHLIPTAIIVVVLLLAWRWEWIGAVLFAVVAALYFFFTALGRHHPEWGLFISLPLLIVGGLFLVNWLKRAELRAKK